jgi:dTDP-4-dehydrorhamnose 3,5-epimerase
MQVRPTEIPGILILYPTKHADERGFFSETFRTDVLGAHGVDAQFVQDNHVYSTEKGILRGLHYQFPPHAQGKLIRCIKGVILDVAVDIRKGSPSFGRHVATKLSATSWQQLWVPAGFAHGYVTMETDCEVIYKVTDYYSPECDRGIAWDDPALEIDWQLPLNEILLSPKDRRQPRLADVDTPFQYT